MKAIVVGAGGVARELLRRLGEMWEIVLIDPDGQRLRQTGDSPRVRTIMGDGSSRLVLRQAGLEEADALVAATGDDDVNLEVCRLAQEAGLLRIAAIAADPDRLADYRELGLPAFSPARLTAREIELTLETRRISSRAFAHGRAEAVEFRVAEDSPVRGKPLRELRARSWLVSAVLRDNELIIPHGETVLQKGDLVTVVGSAADFGFMVRTFASGDPRFPLEFGKRVALALTGSQFEHPLDEALHLARNSRATSVVVVHRDSEAVAPDGEGSQDTLSRLRAESAGIELRLRPARGRPAAALASLPREESVGVMVVRAPSGTGPMGELRARRIVALCRKSRVPVLVSRGSHPYRRILVPARPTPAGRVAARAAIDLARSSGADLVGLAVVDPAFIAGEGAVAEGRQALGWLQEEAAVQGVGVRRKIRRGNPVRTFLELARDGDLLVLGLDRWHHPFQVRVADHLVCREKVSVLLVPVVE